MSQLMQLTQQTEVVYILQSYLTWNKKEMELLFCIVFVKCFKYVVNSPNFSINRKYMKHNNSLLYMFCALAIVCDEFFVPALEVNETIMTHR